MATCDMYKDSTCIDDGRSTGLRGMVLGVYQYQSRRQATSYSLYLGAAVKLSWVLLTDYRLNSMVDIGGYCGTWNGRGYEFVSHRWWIFQLFAQYYPEMAEAQVLENEMSVLLSPLCNVSAKLTSTYSPCRRRQLGTQRCLNFAQ